MQPLYIGWLRYYYKKYIMTESKGLGDTVEKVFHTLGVKKVVKKVNAAVGKKDCGCNKRKEKLNKWFPYKK